MARHKDDISDFWWRVERQLYIQNKTKNVSADYLLFGKDIEKYEPANGGI